MPAKKKRKVSSKTAPTTERRSEEVQLVDICMPNYTNPRGVMFGGKVLELMDKAAAIAAHRYCLRNAVTASTERVDFLTPIEQGDIVDYRAKVVYTGRTSMTIKVTVHSETTIGGVRRLCCIGWVNMVAIGARGRPVRVPRLCVSTPDEKADYARGKSLRLARLRCEI